MTRVSNALVHLRPRMDTLYTSQNHTVLATDRDGFVRKTPDHGLFVHETRLLSHYQYSINGNLPYPVALSNVEQHSWLGYYIVLPPGAEVGPKDQGSGQLEESSEQTLELRLSRYIGDGMHEDCDLTNFSQYRTRFLLSIESDADFADIDETRGERQQQGQITRAWRQTGKDVYELHFDYRVAHTYSHQGISGVERLHRGVTVRVANATSLPFLFEAGKIGFEVDLEPHGSWHACVSVIPWIDGRKLPQSDGCHAFDAQHNELDRLRAVFLKEATGFTTPQDRTLSEVVTGALEQAKRDLASLRLYDLDVDERAWTMAAGLPVYIALFGRDTLTASWQAALAGPGMMRGTLTELARWQGRVVNNWRDEQPGKMIHEAHDGPTKVLNFNPRNRYFGSVTTSGFYPVVLSQLWHWTGNKDLIRPLVDPAMKALRWLDERADLDGDGFYEYKTASTQGVKHQGWKDSGSAIVHEDGSPVEPPIATCEEQGFAYLAKLHMSEILWWLDEKDAAQRLFYEASELKKRFNAAYWMADKNFIAMGLDSRKRQIRSIGSNAGHCLATAILDQELVPKLADRFMASDLFSGWGVRTLSTENPAYNPYSYHRGSVWPVEQGTFAMAFERYGYHDAVDRLARAQFETAELFEHYRLPEVFSGHPRDRDHPFPAIYPRANSPQAWSASSIFCLIQAMLGIYPYAPLNTLLVDPCMPEWLPDVTLSNLRVGDASVTIRFFRTPGGKSDYEVLDQSGPLHVIRQPSPWSLTATYAERLVDTLTSLLPGK
jgi:glycogen debranching enzyme